jgi:hypothetical protein
MATMMMDNKVRAIQDGTTHLALAVLVKFDNPNSLVQWEYGRGPPELVATATMEAMIRLDPKDRRGQSVRTATAALPSYYHHRDNNNSFMEDNKVRAVQDRTSQSALAVLVKFDNPRSLVRWDAGSRALELVDTAKMVAVDRIDPQDHRRQTRAIMPSYHENNSSESEIDSPSPPARHHHRTTTTTARTESTNDNGSWQDMADALPRDGSPKPPPRRDIDTSLHGALDSSSDDDDDDDDDSVAEVVTDGCGATDNSLVRYTHSFIDPPLSLTLLTHIHAPLSMPPSFVFFATGLSDDAARRQQHWTHRHRRCPETRSHHQRSTTGSRGGDDGAQQ